jgi:plastocyanin
MRHRVRLPALLALGIVSAPGLEGQSTLYRPANLGGTWVPGAGVVQFDFVHRFYVAPSSGSHKITNFPTFTLALGLGRDVAVGTHYGTNSIVVAAPYRPNEAEVYARWRPLGAEGRPGLAVSLEPAYNVAARSADGEVSADYTAGPLTVSAAVRGMSRALGRDRARAAVAGGAAARLTDYVAVSGDVGSFVSGGGGARAAWSLALSLVIPNTPHTFSLEVSNAASGTIQGNSIGYARMLYGFEFTIPLHLARFAPWFHRTAAPPAAGGGAGGRGTAEVDVRVAAFAFREDSVTVAAGTVVRWTNRDVVAHTITFDDGAPGSPPLVPGAGFSRRFAAPGTYRYHCTPHPWMKGVVVVR